MLLKQGINIDNIYNKDNFFEIYSSVFIKEFNNHHSVMQEEIIENIKTLKKYLSNQHVFEVIKHNFNLFISDNNELKKSLLEIEQIAAGDKNKFVKLFHKLINKNE